jgi:CBS domain-containing protein
MLIDTVLRTRQPRIVTVRMTDTVLSAARRLRAEDVGVLVVKDTCATEGDAVLGVISERHVLQAIVDRGMAALTLPVSMLMSRIMVRCQLHDTVVRALALMHEHDVRHLPVLHDDALVGVVSMRDLLAVTRPEPAIA